MFIFLFSPSLFACSLSQRCGGLTFIFAHILVRALVGGPGSQPTDTVDNTQSVVRALTPTLAVQQPHVCHRQRDGTVSIGSHMQHMEISEALPHLGAPFPLFHAVHVRKPRSKKLGNIVVICECFNASVPPRQAPLAQNHAQMHMQILGRKGRLVCQGGSNRAMSPRHSQWRVLSELTPSDRS